MKCPLRKIITKSGDGYTQETITEEFADCYGKECVLYYKCIHTEIKHKNENVSKY